MVRDNSVLLGIDQYRLLMCCRMVKSLLAGEVFIDATTHRMKWHIERKGKPDFVFSSLDEMEEYLEHLLMNRKCYSIHGLGHMNPEVKKRASVINERRRSQTKQEPMMFYSKINVKKIWPERRNAITAGR